MVPPGSSRPEGGSGRLVQTAFVTLDIHATMTEMTTRLGIGPWFLRERGVFPRQIYRGRPADTALAIAMGYSGDMQFELIQQLDDTPSVYREVIDRTGPGLHHFGMAVDDYATALSHFSSRASAASARPHRAAFSSCRPHIGRCGPRACFRRTR